MRGFEPSLLEKLFDDEPRQPGQGTLKRLSLEDFKDSVARDVEALLNNRASADEDLLAAYPHCRRSIASYGIGDFSARSLASMKDRDHICRCLEQTIALHEPRLIQVKVSLNQLQGTTGALRFSIGAMLVVHPAREPVSFDALLQPTTLQYSVSKARRQAIA